MSSEWIYNNAPFLPDQEELKMYSGFVYEIFNHTNGKEYIGKKEFWQPQTLKGQAQAQESDWRSYTGSCNELNKDINCGHYITKTVTRLCRTNGDCQYFEMEAQVKMNVLFRDDFYNGSDFYNGQIVNRFFKLKIS